MPLDFQDGYATSLGKCVYVVPQSIGYKAYGYKRFINYFVSQCIFVNYCFSPIRCTYFSASQNCIERPGNARKPFPYCCPKYQCPGHIPSKYQFP